MRRDYEQKIQSGEYPQRRRRAEITTFKSDPACRVFLSTDSGGLGLNLQNASVVVNCDLPWNPAKLEQRIGRAWRKFQTKSVTVVNLVAENTIESRMLETLAAKKGLADGVLDGRGNFSEIFPAEAENARPLTPEEQRIIVDLRKNAARKLKAARALAQAELAEEANIPLAEASMPGGQGKGRGKTLGGAENHCGGIGRTVGACLGHSASGTHGLGRRPHVGSPSHIVRQAGITSRRRWKMSLIKQSGYRP